MEQLQCFVFKTLNEYCLFDFDILSFVDACKMSLEQKVTYPVVYEARTTYADSYKKFEGVKRQRNISTRDRSEAPPQIKPPPKVRDNETMCYFREESKVPFNLLWERKEITQTNPYECFVKPVVSLFFLCN